MTMRLAITHVTGYEYEGEVVASYNLARLTPRSVGGQLVLDHRIVVDPGVATFPSIDYWGTVVHAFDVHVPHRRLEVTGRSDVVTADAVGPPADAPGFDVLERDDVVDQFAELLAPSSMTAADEVVAALAGELRAGQSPVETVERVIEWVRDHVGYERGVTSVATPATGVLAARRGVCQDFAHLTVALLRAARVPARYVSGYLYPLTDGEVGVSLDGESHAWVDAWAGGWWSVDPTSGETAGDRHVRVAHGRDYQDVAPLAGIYHGAPSKSLMVHVDLTRLT